MNEGDIFLTFSCIIVFSILFVAYRRRREEKRLRAERIWQESVRQEMSMKFQESIRKERLTKVNQVPLKSTPVVENKTQRTRYDDRRGVDTTDDTLLQNMLIMNAISNSEPTYVSSDNLSRSTTYDYSSDSSSSSSYDSSSSDSSSSSFD